MSPASPGGGFLHPVPVLAVAVLLLNDHWAKLHFPGWVTGKLSDVAGLCFFPLLLQALVEITTRTRADRRVLVGSLALTAVGFTLVKSVPAVTGAWAGALGWLQSPWAVVGPSASRAVTDPTDLLALPALAVAAAVGWRRSATLGAEATGPGADRPGAPG